MPRAGEIPAHRAIAHLRWAERYNGLGDVSKATSHTERGLDYIRLSTGFGANQRRAEFSNIKEANAEQGWHEAKLPHYRYPCAGYDHGYSGTRHSRR